MKKNFEIQEIDDQLIINFLNGKLSLEEANELSELLDSSPEKRELFKIYQKIWIGSSVTYPDDKFSPHKAWKKIVHAINRPTYSQVYQSQRIIRRMYIRFARIAALFLVVFLVGAIASYFIFSNYNGVFGEGHCEISVPHGSRSRIVLPDSSVVWLNAGSKLNYNADFDRGNRVVTLSGEAYFDVQYHELSVFLIHTQNADIRVLGTQLNVKSYPNEDIFETTVISGRVEVSVIDENRLSQPILLVPNQRMIYSRDEGNVKLQPLPEKNDDDIVVEEVQIKVSPKPSIILSQISNPEEFTSWVDGKLVLKSEPLVSLARKLERFYNVNISFEDDSIKDLRYTGTLEEVTIEEVLRAISSASSINYKIDKNQVTLSN